MTPASTLMISWSLQVLQRAHLSEPELLTLPGSRGGPGPRCTRDEGPQGEASFPEEAAA